MDNTVKASLVLGALIAVGLGVLGYTLGSSAIRFKEYERVVSVKGLAEREVPANIAIWPINFSGADSDLTALYSKLEGDAARIIDFLKRKGFEADEITVAAPEVTDKLAQRYGGNEQVRLATPPASRSPSIPAESTSCAVRRTISPSSASRASLSVATATSAPSISSPSSTISSPR